MIVGLIEPAAEITSIDRVQRHNLLTSIYTFNYENETLHPQGHPAVRGDVL